MRTNSHEALCVLTVTNMMKVQSWPFIWQILCSRSVYQ